VAVAIVNTARLAIRLVPLGRIGAAEDLEEDWCLATQGGSARRRRCQRHRAARWYPLGGDGTVLILQVLGTWQCVMPARRSGAKFRLAALDARQAVLVQ